MIPSDYYHNPLLFLRLWPSPSRQFQITPQRTCTCCFNKRVSHIFIYKTKRGFDQQSKCGAAGIRCLRLEKGYSKGSRIHKKKRHPHMSTCPDNLFGGAQLRREDKRRIHWRPDSLNPATCNGSFHLFICKPRTRLPWIPCRTSVITRPTLVSGDKNALHFTPLWSSRKRCLQNCLHFIPGVQFSIQSSTRIKMEITSLTSITVSRSR